MSMNKKQIVQAIRDYRDEEELSKTDYDSLDAIIDTLEEIKPSRVYIKHVMDQQKQRDMINQFQEWYYDTDQNVETFSTEFCYVVDKILNNEVPIKLEFLVDYQNDLSDLLGISIEIL